MAMVWTRSRASRGLRLPASGSGRPARPTRDVLVWAIIFACLTIGGAVWLDLQHLDYEDFSPAILLIAYSPALAAIVTAAAVSGRRGIRALLSQFGHWRAGVGWYAIAAFGPLAVVLLVGIVMRQSGSPPVPWLVLPALATVPSLLSGR